MDPHSHDIQPGVLPPATEVQVLPPATEVEPTITLTQDSIDPAFRLPVPVPTIEQTQQPQDLPGHTTSNPDGQTTQPKRKEKPSKKGASVPRLRKACDSCSKRKVKVCHAELCAVAIASELSGLIIVMSTVRRGRQTLQSLREPRHPLHLREAKSTSRSSKPSCRCHQGTAWTCCRHRKWWAIFAHICRSDPRLPRTTAHTVPREHLSEEIARSSGGRLLQVHSPAHPHPT